MSCMCDWPGERGGTGVEYCDGCGGDQCVCICGGERECAGCTWCDYENECAEIGGEG